MKLYLIRHGESEANVNKSVYFSKPDSLIELTEKGKEQALEVGKKIKYDLDGHWYIYNSPYKRARATKDLLLQVLDPNELSNETVLLREQEHPFHRSQKERDIFLIRRKNSPEPFFYKEMGYESYCDVAQRAEMFLIKLKQEVSTDANVIIVAHEVMIRMLLMVIDSIPYEESKINIGNCELIKRVL